MTNRLSYNCISHNRNGSPTSVMRWGVADREGPGAVYGDVDRAALSYDGNQLVSVSDAAQYLSYAGASDLPNGSSELSYDACGNLASDTGRGIESLAYNRLGLPVRAGFADGSVVRLDYDALGAKLAETDSTPLSSLVAPMSSFEPFPGGIGGGITVPRFNVTKTEYAGSCVYRGGKLLRVLFPGGYATPRNGGGYDYHYFVLDYLGSVCAVVAEDGTVEETADYYPYGMQVAASDGTIKSVQPYKFGGKEHLTAAGLNHLDFGPRSLYAPACQFSAQDPKCEDYPHLSPYLYCAANPTNVVDPTGEDALLIIDGNKITITANIIIWGEHANEDLANKYQAAIDNTWGKIKEYKILGVTYNLEWDVKVSVGKGTDIADFNGINNYMKVVLDESSKVSGSNHGFLYYEDETDEVNNPLPHEFGHMLGLNDKYVTEGPNYGKPIAEKYRGNIMAVHRSSPVKNISQEDLNSIFINPLFDKYINKFIEEPMSILSPSVYYINDQSRTQKRKSDKDK